MDVCDLHVVGDVADFVDVFDLGGVGDNGYCNC